MALSGNYSKTVTGFSNVTAPTYARVKKVSASKYSGTIDVVFLSADKSTVLDEKQYSFIPSVASGATNFIEQAYVALMAMSDFAGYSAC